MTDFSTREKQDVVRALKAIRKLLQRKGLPVVKGRPHIKKSTVITHARVPVIKLTAVVPGHRQPVNMDISIGANNGLAAIQTVRRFVRENAALRPLTLLLKAILRSRGSVAGGLNETFTGGIGSYVLVNMICAFLVRLRAGREDLGALFLDLVEHYAQLDYSKHTISVRRGGLCARLSPPPKPKPKASAKRKRAAGADAVPLSLSVEDPQEEGREMGLATYRMGEVRAALLDVFARLRGAAPADRGGDERMRTVEAGQRGGGERMVIDLTGDDDDDDDDDDIVLGLTPASKRTEERWADVQRDGSHTCVSASAGAAPRGDALAGSAPKRAGSRLDVAAASRFIAHAMGKTTIVKKPAPRGGGAAGTDVLPMPKRVPDDEQALAGEPAAGRPGAAGAADFPMLGRVLNVKKALAGKPAAVSAPPRSDAAGGGPRETELEAPEQADVRALVVQKKRRHARRESALDVEQAPAGKPAAVRAPPRSDAAVGRPREAPDQGDVRAIVVQKKRRHANRMPAKRRVVLGVTKTLSLGDTGT